MLKKEKNNNNKTYLIYRRRKWQITPVFFPGEFHGTKSLGGTVHFSSVARSCLTLCDPMDYSTSGLPVHHQLPEFIPTLVHWIDDASNYLNLCHPLLLQPSIFPNIRFFSKESVLPIRWPKYWSFSFSIVLPVIIQDWFLYVRLAGSPCSPRNSQEFSPIAQSKASILWCSAFFMVKLSHPYLTSGKTIAWLDGLLLPK